MKIAYIDMKPIILLKNITNTVAFKSNNVVYAIERNISMKQITI